MKITPDERFKSLLLKVGRKDLVNGFTVDDSHYASLLKEAKRLHPDSGPAEWHRWAAYSSRTLKEKEKKVLLTKTRSKACNTVALVLWRIGILLLLLDIALRH